MSEIRDKIKEHFRESKHIIIAHSRNESMSLTEKRENIELEEDHFAAQILSIPELAIVDRKVGLPEPHMHPPEGVLIRFISDLRKAGWVKEVKE